MSCIDIERYAQHTTVKTLVVRDTTREERVRLASQIEGARPGATSVSFAPNPLLLPRIVRLLEAGVTYTDAAQVWIDSYKEQVRTAYQLAAQQDIALLARGADKLWPYQRVGVAWLARQKRTILADECGLGKTVEALVACAEVGATSILVVTLASVKRQWQEEMQTWLGVDAVVVDGTREERKALLAEKPPYLILNYDVLREAVATRPKVVGGKKREGHAAAYPELLHRFYDVIIFDEAQKLQNHNPEKSQQSRAARQVAKKGKYLFELTGTPVWNELDSCWHLLHLIDPVRFPSYNAFVTYYCDIRETIYGRQIVGIRTDRLPELHRVLAEYMLRRTKEDVRPDLPPKLFSTLHYDLSPEQQDIYRTMRRDCVLPGKRPKYYANTAAQLADLRFLCDAPQLLGFDLPSPKDTVLFELLERLFAEKSRKVALFVWHQQYGQYLTTLLSRKHYRVLSVVGKAGSEREQMVRDEFAHGNAQILIGTIGGIGTGLNMGFADTAIMAELDWTPANNVQATDRLHRATTTHQVTIYRLIAKESIEQHILDVTEHKASIADEALALREIVRRVESSDFPLDNPNKV